MAVDLTGKPDFAQVIKSVYNEEANALQITNGAAITAPSGSLEVAIDQTEDSIAIGDGTNLFTSTTVGSSKALDVNVVNTVPISGTITTTNPANGTPGDPIPSQATLVGGSDGTDLQPLKVSASGVLSVDGSATTQPISGSISVSNFPSTQNVNITNSSIAVTGPLTDTQLRASAVPITGTVIANLGTIAGIATETTLSSLNSKVTAVNTGAVVISSSALPSGASTSVLQTTANTSLSSIDSKLTSPLTTNTTVTSSALPSGASTSANQTTTNTSLSSIDGKTPALGQTTMVGSSPVVIASNQSAIPVSGTFFQTTQPVSGTVAVSSLPSIPTGSNAIGSVSVSNFPATQAISAASLPLPTNAATSANQSTANTSLASIDSKLTSPITVTGTVTSTIATAAKGTTTTGNPTSTNVDSNTQGLDVVVKGTVATTLSGTPSVSVSNFPASQAVTGTFFQSTQPVSASSLPLPSGASTSSLQTTGNSSLSSIDTKTPALGQALAAASIPVVLTAAQLTTLTPVTSVTVNNASGASAVNIQDGGNSITVDGSVGITGSVAVTGPLTDAQLRATAVPVSLTSTTITGTIAATQSGTWSIRNQDGSGNSLASSTTTPTGTEQALIVRNIASGTQAISAASLPLPSGAATESTLSTLNTKVPSNLTVTSTRLLVDGSGVTQPVSGSVSITGTPNVAVTSSVLPTGAATEASLVKLPLTQASTTSGQSGTLIQGAVTTAAPTYTNAQTNPLSLTTSGALRTDSSGSTQPISGTVTANIGTTNGLALDTSVNSLLKPASTLAAVTTVSAVTAITNALPIGTNSIGQVTANAGTNLNTSALNLETTQSTMSAKLPATLGQKAMVASLAVTIASDQTAVPASQSGTWNINNVSGTVSLPTGASTSALQTTGNSSLSSIDGKLPTLSTTSGNLNVNIAAGTVAVSTEAIYNTTPPTLSNGQSVSLQTNVNGALKIDGSSTTQPVSGTVTANLGTIAGVATETTLSSLNSKVTAVNTGAVVVSSSALPSGASTSALQTTGNTSLNSIDTKIPALGQALAAASVPVVLTASQLSTLTPLSTLAVSSVGGSVAVTGTFFQATQPVSAVSLPLPTGAATAANQSTANTSLSSIDSKLTSPITVSGTFFQATQPVSGTVTSNIGTTNGLALDATLTGGTQKSLIRGTVKGTTTAADVTSTNVDANTQALDVAVKGTVATTLSGTPSVSVSNFPSTQPISGTITAITNTVTIKADTAGNQTNSLKVDGSAVTQPVSISGTVPISAASLPLPTGAATETTLSALNTKVPSQGQALAAASFPVVLTAAQVTTLTPLSTVTANLGTIAGVATETTLSSLNSKVTAVNTGAVVVSSSALPTGAATEVSLVKLPLAQASTTTGQSGTLIQGAVTTAAPTYTTAQTNPLSLTTAGALRVDASGSTQPISGTIAATQSGTWNITNVSGTVSLPTGASTSALQTTGNSSLSSIDTKIPSNLTVTATRLLTDGSGVTQPVSGTFFQATQPVSGTVAVSSLPAIPAGANAIGSVSVSNFPASQAVTGTFFQATQPVSGTITANAGTNLNTSLLALDSTVAKDASLTTLNTSVNTLLKPASTLAAVTTVSTVTAVTAITNALPAGTNSIGTIQQATLTKGTQGATGVTTQDLKDAGRNQTNFYMPIQIVTTGTDALISLTGYKSGAAVGATTTPAVVTAAKTYRINSVTMNYTTIVTTPGSVRFTLRANTGGTVLISSPAVTVWEVGEPDGIAPVAGKKNTVHLSFPDGIEFAAGTGIGISQVGLNTVGAAAVVGYGQISIHGYEY